MGLDKLIQPAQLLGLSSGPKFCECNNSHDILKWPISEILDVKTIFFATQYDAQLLLLSHGIIRLQANGIAGNAILIIIKLESELVYMYMFSK